MQKWALNADGTRNVQITFMNPGGLRADLDEGVVTYREAANVQPFAQVCFRVLADRIFISLYATLRTRLDGSHQAPRQLRL